MARATGVVGAKSRKGMACWQGVTPCWLGRNSSPRPAPSLVGIFFFSYSLCIPSWL